MTYKLKDNPNKRAAIELLDITGGELPHQDQIGEFIALDDWDGVLEYGLIEYYCKELFNEK